MLCSQVYGLTMVLFACFFIVIACDSYLTIFSVDVLLADKSTIMVYRELKLALTQSVQTGLGSYTVKNE